MEAPVGIRQVRADMTSPNMQPTVLESGCMSQTPHSAHASCGKFECRRSAAWFTWDLLDGK
jgi:hypothetical protein